MRHSIWLAASCVVCHCVTYTGWLFYKFLACVVRRASLDLAGQQIDFFSLSRVSCVALSLRLSGCLINFFCLRCRSLRHLDWLAIWLIFLPASCVAVSLILAGCLINFFSLRRASCVTASLRLPGCLIDFLSLRRASCVMCHCVTYTGCLFD